jgi:hypothetical protein
MARGDVYRKHHSSFYIDLDGCGSCRLHKTQRKANINETITYIEVPVDMALARFLGFLWYSREPGDRSLDGAYRDDQWIDCTMDRNIDLYLHPGDEVLLAGLSGEELSAEMTRISELNLARRRGRHNAGVEF